jgi:hypothetical protein
MGKKQNTFQDHTIEMIAFRQLLRRIIILTMAHLDIMSNMGPRRKEDICRVTYVSTRSGH